MIEDYRLAWADELPVEKVPDSSNWSENYAFYAYDFDRKTGFMAFAGRWIKNPALWREQLYIYLPDGSLLSHRAIGLAHHPSSLCPSALRFQCDSPGERWEIGFDGAMRHDDFDTLCREPILEGRPHNVRLVAVLESNTPALMLTSKDNTSHGKYHYEQGHLCRGSISFDGTQYALDGLGYRDHSRGPRKLGTFDGHIWLQLFFPDGRIFASYQVWTREAGRSEQILDDSIAIISNQVHPATLRHAPRLTTLDTLRAPLELGVTLGVDRVELKGTPLSSLPNSFTEDFDFYHGVAPQLAEFMSIDQPVLFDSDAGKIKGYVQRSMRISDAKRDYG